MHRVFGKKENAEYQDRPGAYLIPIQAGCVAVVRTEKGFFLLGGGKEAGESDEECILRECMEETGYAVSVGRKICSAESYMRHPTIGYFHPVQSYYTGELLKRVCEPGEPDHQLVWATCSEIRGNMFSEMQNWALELVLQERSLRD